VCLLSGRLGKWGRRCFIGAAEITPLLPFLSKQGLDIMSVLVLGLEKSSGWKISYERSPELLLRRSLVPPVQRYLPGL
jgi:hypothetical protein